MLLINFFILSSFIDLKYSESTRNCAVSADLFAAQNKIVFFSSPVCVLFVFVFTT